MAPGRTAERFLATFSRATSAGVIPALVVVALVLAGCGGGSSGDAGPTPASAAAGDESGTGAPPAHVAQDGKSASEAPGGGSGANPQPPAGEGRHGPPVPMPSGEEAPKITPQQRREATVAD